MKKSIVALAVLGSFASVASAQSSVTLFGVIDVAARYTKANGQTLKSLATDGNTNSRLGVRGEEDLGGGLKAGFWVEGMLSADAGTTDGSRFWGRRSTISLNGEFGEVRLGRNKTAAQLQIEAFDPTSTTGLGKANQLYSTLTTDGATKNAAGLSTQPKAEIGRYDNLVSYSLPGNLGGFYGVVEAAAGEGASNGKMFGGRAGYLAGPLHVSAAYLEAGVGTKFKLTTFGGSYDLGTFKPSLTVSTTKFGAAKQNIITAAVTAPLGAGSVWASWTKADANDAAEALVDASKKNLGVGDATHLSAGYIYNLSKRTALYTTVSKIENKGSGTFGVLNTPKVAAGGGSGGFDVGMRHSF